MSDSTKPSGVYVRAICQDGRYDAVDALTLDDESFRRFVLGVLADADVVCSFNRDEPRVPLRSLQEAKRDD